LTSAPPHYIVAMPDTPTPANPHEFLELAHHLIDALKKVTKSGTTDEDIRRIVTGGITNERDVVLDELQYQMAHGKNRRCRRAEHLGEGRSPRRLWPDGCLFLCCHDNPRPRTGG
jgi:hypothetical protein